MHFFIKDQEKRHCLQNNLQFHTRITSISL